MNIREQLIDALEHQDFSTFNNLVEQLDIGGAGRVAKKACEARCTDGFKIIVQHHPQRNYSLALQYIISQSDSDLGLWLLENSPKTTIGSWDITSYADLNKQVDEKLYTALIERQVQYLEPQFIMASAQHHRRVDFAQLAVDQLECFPSIENNLNPSEQFFLTALVGFKQWQLVDHLIKKFPQANIVHHLITKICTAYHPTAFIDILKPLLKMYSPTDHQRSELNAIIFDLVEYNSEERDIIRCLIPYYDPHFRDGKIFLSSVYLDDEHDFTLFLGATPLEIQKKIWDHLQRPIAFNKPPHLQLLQNRIADLETRLKLQVETDGIHTVGKIRQI